MRDTAETSHCVLHASAGIFHHARAASSFGAFRATRKVAVEEGSRESFGTFPVVRGLRSASPILERTHPAQGIPSCSQPSEPGLFQFAAIARKPFDIRQRYALCRPGQQRANESLKTAYTCQFAQV
jgi:hypothetical protein